MVTTVASTFDSVLSDKSMFGEIENTAKIVPNNTAYSFYGKSASYTKLIEEIELCARGLKTLGVKQGDVVTIMLPNCPQAVLMVYAINAVGAIANMVHPLSSERDIEISLQITKSKYAITMDTFAQSYVNLQSKLALEKVIVTYIQEGMGTIQGLLYPFVSKTKKIKFDQPYIIMWKDFLKQGSAYTGEYRADVKAKDPAIIIHTGGTTGTPKGALHCNEAFNALARQIVPVCGINSSDRVLAIVPVFHGFGLGVSIHSALVSGANVFLLPRYFADEYAKITVKNKITYHIGTPSLFESFIHVERLQNADLSFIRGLFSGGDYLTNETKTNVTKFIQDRGSACYPRQGYGLAEMIGAIALEPTVPNKECSIGKAFPGIDVMVCKADTEEEVPVGETGELCFTGPNAMMEYLDNVSETEKVLKTHADGRLWVHTGDLGHIDEDKDIYYTQRLKRMIVTNGYNVYPSQIEEVFDAHNYVRVSCAIGAPDERKGQKVIVYVVLNDENMDKEAAKTALLEYGRKMVAKFAKPADIIFVDKLPLTMLNKVDYRALEKQYVEKDGKQ